MAALPGAGLPGAGAPRLGVTEKAGLSFVSAGGNAQGQTLGFSNDFSYAWPRSSFQCNLGGMRARTVTPRRAAYGSSARYQVRESWVSTPTAENYFLNLRYDSGLTEHLVWIGAGGWARNPPAGIRDRLHASLGLGWYWLRGAEIQVRTDLGAGHQRDRLVAPRPGERKGYSTASLGTRLEGKAGQGAAYSSDLAFTFNLSEERAWQGVWRTALTFNLRTFLAVKLGYDLTYTNRPPDAQVDLYGTPGDQAPLGTVPFPVRRLDTLLTTSLVVTF